MTRKENLLTIKYNLQNQLRSLRGEELWDIESLTSGYRFHQLARSSREADLTEEIERLQRSIKEQERDNDIASKTEAYYQTEEGRARQAELQQYLRLEDVDRNLRSTEMRQELNQWIGDFIGEHWRLLSLSTSCVKFAVWSEVSHSFVFGQDFTIYYDLSRTGEIERFEVNVGTTGSFSATDSEIGDRARFYADFGHFLSDTSRLLELKTKLHDFAFFIEESEKCSRRLYKKLKNPLNLQ